MTVLSVVMGRTPFYTTLNELEHHISNIERTQTYLFFGSEQTDIQPKRLTKLFIEQTRTSFFLNMVQTQTCSSFSNRTRTPYFWLRTIELRT